MSDDKMEATKFIEEIDPLELFRRAGIFNQMDELRNKGYFTAPASRSHHLANYGGLVEHSVNVTRRLVALTQSLGVEWPRPESPYLVGLLHDLVKCECYSLKENSAADKPEWAWNQPVYPGHGACSVAIAAECGFELRREEIAAITYHMGTYGIGKEYTAEQFDVAISKFGQQIIATFCADWYAARVDEAFERNATK